ncbi:MAG: hypothetical protein INH43_17690 [Acidobacteriaceae bacterium]|nr:hypothetical protein [Acidobacteriaceae bacterium]
MPSLLLLRAGACAAAALLLGFAAAQAPRPEPAAGLRWWKGNLHTHTLWSDGDGFPDMVAAWYRDHGYHFLALSEHNVFAQSERWMPSRAINRRAGVDAVAAYRARFGPRWVESRGQAADGSEEIRLKTLDEVRAMVDEPRRFLLIPSVELTGTAGDGRSLHMNATNLAASLSFRRGATIAESMVRNLEQVEEYAARTGREVLLHVNHPNYKWGITAEDLASVVQERFFEVWNGVDNDNDPGDAQRPSTDALWDIANALRLTRYDAPPLYGLATDDTHEHHGNKTRALPGRAWVMVRAPHLSADSIVRALRAGDFYSSTGVTLTEVAYSPAERRLSLRIEPVAGEEFTTRFVGVRRQGTAGELLAEVKGLTPAYTLKPGERYVRAVVTSTGKPAVPSDEFPTKRAWTQPVGW